MSQMKYADLHCDSLTECSNKGFSLADGDLQVNLAKLKKGGCAVQCFAIFTQGTASALRFYEYLGFYKRCLKEQKIKAVLSYADFESCILSGGTGAVLTVENLGFLSDLAELETLKREGVRMASLVWNYENQFAYPNLTFVGDAPDFAKRNKKGLKDFGRKAVELLDENKIIVDVSHLSDGGTDEILSGRKIPTVASHSNCAAVNPVSRNLTDGQIKKIADCGGVVGVNFCKDFLDGDETFSSVLKHIEHIINIGGEDTAALGSDFDGIPAPPELEDCTKMPKLFSYLQSNGISESTLEKLCYKNFARVFKDVCG